MIKEIKFTDKAIKQINFLLNDKKRVLILESPSKAVDVQVFNMTFLLKMNEKMMTLCMKKF